MSAPKQTCAMCGQGGYWVGYSAEHGEDRCVNHLGREPSESGQGHPMSTQHANLDDATTKDDLRAALQAVVGKESS